MREEDVVKTAIHIRQEFARGGGRDRQGSVNQNKEM